MQLTKYVFLLLSLCLTFTFVSCNIEPFDGDITQDSENKDDFPNETGGFKVDFDSQTYIADNATAVVQDGFINISATRGDKRELITITLFGDTTGTYPIGVTIGNLEVNGAAYTTDSTSGNGDTWVGATDFTESQGEVIITEIDSENKTISGSFSFTGHHPTLGIKEFTNGSFSNISFAAGVVSPSENDFFAKVDGVEFEEETINGVLVTLGGISTIGISATINTTRVIGLNLDGNITPGEYELSTFGVPSGLYSISFSESFSSEKGKVTITSHDKTNKRITGTFEFTASSVLISGSYEITEGSFDVTYF